MSGLQVMHVALETLPSVRRYVEAVANDLCDGITVIGLLPAGITPDLVGSEVYDLVYGRGRLVDRLSLAQVPLPLESDGIVRLAAGLDPQREEWGQPLEMVLADNRCPQVVFVEDLCHTDQPAEWLRLLAKWGDIAHALPHTATNRPAILVLEHASSLLQQLPAPQPRLKLHFWWGFPSALELGLLCRGLAPHLDARSVWLESVLTSVSAGDLALLEHLWDACPGTVAELQTALCQYAERLGWDRDACWLADGTVDVTTAICQQIESQPPAHLRSVWAHGQLIGSFEHGREVHPALLALRGDEHAVQHLLWRGQSQIILPFVDQVRLTFCLALGRAYDRWWDHFGMVPIDPRELERFRESPLTAELGFLRAIIREHRNWPRRNALLHDWEGAIEWAWRVRNEVAHYTPISLSDFRIFWGMIWSRGAV